MSSSNWSQYGVSSDGSQLMCIGRPSAPGESPKYGYKFYKTIFKRKCPHCGSSELYWSIFWAGNETSNWGTFPATGRKEGGSAEGHVFCKKCDADYSCIEGKEHLITSNYHLTIVSQPVASSKEEAYKLKQGQLSGGGNSNENTTSNNSTYGDMLLDLAKPLDGDIMLLQYQNKVKVCKIPNQDTAKLWLKEGVNIVHDSVTVQDYNPETTNKLYVQWSGGVIIVTNDDLIERFGEKEEIITATKTVTKQKWVEDNASDSNNEDTNTANDESDINE